MDEGVSTIGVGGGYVGVAAVVVVAIVVAFAGVIVVVANGRVGRPRSFSNGSQPLERWTSGRRGWSIEKRMEIEN